MPIAEFKCPKCGEKIEVLNGVEAKCKCGTMMKKVVSAPAFKVYTKV